VEVEAVVGVEADLHTVPLIPMVELEATAVKRKAGSCLAAGVTLLKTLTHGDTTVIETLGTAIVTKKTLNAKRWLTRNNFPVLLLSSAFLVYFVLPV
jgi:hypothetical protein